MLSKLHSATVVGTHVLGVKVEVELRAGLPAFHIVGLAQNAVREGKNRIISALRNSGVDWGNKSVTVNLAPANIKKDGTLLDLPIAMAIISALGLVPRDQLAKTLIVGELSLGGSVLTTRATLPIADYAEKQGFETIMVPYSCGWEVSFVDGIECKEIQNLSQVVDHLQNKLPLASSKTKMKTPVASLEPWNEIKGQALVRRAMQIAAAGEHNILLLGPPGVGKTFVAERSRCIFPDLTGEEIREMAKVRSVEGIEASKNLEWTRPFRRPHHSASTAGLIGGGRPFRLGEYSLAHQGILFLDEMAEFRRDALEALREPLESGELNIARSEGVFELPANFLLMGTSNLCACGGMGDERKSCTCSRSDILRYQRKISAPIRDRMDLILTVPKINWDELRSEDDHRSGEAVRASVIHSRRVQERRYGSRQTNGRVSAKVFWDHLKLDDRAENFVKRAMEKQNLSFRSTEKILRVSQTIVDLKNKDAIEVSDIAEAIQFRRNPMEEWGQ